MNTATLFKVWAIFCLGCQVNRGLFGEFVADHRPARKEVENGALKVYHDLILRTADTNDRISGKAEEEIQQMLHISKVRSSGAIQEQLLKPLKAGKEHPKIAIAKAELVLYLVDELGDSLGEPPVTVENVTQFGLSGVNHTNPTVRKVGEKIVLKMYDLDGDFVRDMLPPDSSKTRMANLNYRRLFEAFDRRDGKSPRR